MYGGNDALDIYGLSTQLRQYTLVYNRLTDKCFQGCVCDLSLNSLTTEEVDLAT